MISVFCPHVTHNDPYNKMIEVVVEGTDEDIDASIFLCPQCVADMKATFAYDIMQRVYGDFELWAGSYFPTFDIQGQDKE